MKGPIEAKTSLHFLSIIVNHLMIADRLNVILHLISTCRGVSATTCKYISGSSEPLTSVRLLYLLPIGHFRGSLSSSS